MSTGWSIWVMFLVVLNMGITFFLFLWAPHAKIPTLADGTTGHVWAHGALREGVRRLPMWWVLLSAAMFAGAFGYLILYPGFGNYKGALEWSARGQLAKAVAANDAKLGVLIARANQVSVEQLASDSAARQLGNRLFDDNCAACHGLGGPGNRLLGAPNLGDGDWLYGGDGETIVASIHDGRRGVMPPWSALGEETVDNLTQYVLALSGQEHDAAAAEKGKPMFATCSACHGADGRGNPALGAPNLTDAIWLYGGTQADIHATIHDGRQGQMPNWDKRLSEDQIKLVAAYVYSLSHPKDDPSP